MWVNYSITAGKLGVEGAEGGSGSCSRRTAHGQNRSQGFLRRRVELVVTAADVAASPGMQLGL